MFQYYRILQSLHKVVPVLSVAGWLADGFRLSVAGWLADFSAICGWLAGGFQNNSPDCPTSPNSAAEVSGMRQVVGDRLYHTLGEATGVPELKFINP